VRRHSRLARIPMTAPTTKLAEFVSTLDLSDIPPTTIELVTQHSLDTIAGFFAGCRVQEALTVCQLLPNTTACWAGRAAMLARAAESDPIHSNTTICAGAVAITAMLGAARELAVDGPTAICAIIAGYETSIRIGAALGSSRLLSQGWWPTAICGGAGAAAAAARAMELDGRSTRDAIALAIVQAGGLGTGGAEAPEARNLLCANTVRTGFEAAEAAAAGVRGPSEPLTGERGFLYAFGVDPNPALLLENLGKRWSIDETSLKAFPCALQAQSALSALGSILRSQELMVEKIEAIEMALPDAMRRIVDQPIPPQSRFAAAASLQFLTAALVHDGDVIPGRLDSEARTDGAIADLINRVTVIHDPDLDARFPASWPARVTVLHDGKLYDASNETPLGHPDRPIGLEQTKAKFHQFSSGNADDLQALILDLPLLESVTPICDAINEKMPS